MTIFASSANRIIAYTFPPGVFECNLFPELRLVVGRAVVDVVVGAPGRFGLVTPGVGDFRLDEAPRAVVDGELEGMKGTWDGNGPPISDVRSTGGRVDYNITQSQRSVSDPKSPCLCL